MWYINQAAAERAAVCTLKIEQCKKTAYANKHQKRELEKSRETLKILLRAEKASIRFNHGKPCLNTIY